jgi:hypothetical protein
MNKTSKELDLSSIITQVSKDDDNKNRPTPLPTATITTATPQTTNGTKSK